MEKLGKNIKLKVFYKNLSSLYYIPLEYIDKFIHTWYIQTKVHKNKRPLKTGWDT